jgi:hypothetical protein
MKCRVVDEPAFIFLACCERKQSIRECQPIQFVIGEAGETLAAELNFSNPHHNRKRSGLGKKVYLGLPSSK